MNETQSVVRQLRKDATRLETVARHLLQQAKEILSNDKRAKRVDQARKDFFELLSMAETRAMAKELEIADGTCFSYHEIAKQLYVAGYRLPEPVASVSKCCGADVVTNRCTCGHIEKHHSTNGYCVIYGSCSCEGYKSEPICTKCGKPCDIVEPATPQPVAPVELSEKIYVDHPKGVKMDDGYYRALIMLEGKGKMIARLEYSPSSTQEEREVLLSLIQQSQKEK